METRSLAAYWNEISISLGLSRKMISNSIKVAGDSYQCWSEALKQWIQQNYNTKKFGEPSWRRLLKAIAVVNRAQCKELAVKHQLKGELLHTVNYVVSCNRYCINGSRRITVCH